MERWAAPAIAAALALVAGFGIGFVVYGNDDAADTARPGPAITTIPSPTDGAGVAGDEGRETCLAALDEAERDLQAEERVGVLVDEYETLIGDAMDALSRLDTRRLERLLSEVEELNERSQRLIDETRTTDLSDAVATCRAVLGA